MLHLNAIVYLAQGFTPVRKSSFRRRGAWGAQPTKKLKCFILTNSYIVTTKKHQININNDNMSFYENLHEYDEEEEQQQHSCEILDTSRYVSGSNPSDDDSSDEYDYDFDIQDLQSPKAAGEEAFPHFDLTDPLRYCLELGEITPNEYDKWKIVQEEEEPRPQSQSQSKTRPDFGPGYNSDSDTDEEFMSPTTHAGYYSYGNGYVTRLQHTIHRELRRRVHPRTLHRTPVHGTRRDKS